MGEGTRRLQLGVAGLGRAFTVMLPTFLADSRVTLIAAADARPEARERFAADFSAKTYGTVEELCADPRTFAADDLDPLDPDAVLPVLVEMPALAVGRGHLDQPALRDGEHRVERCLRNHLSNRANSLLYVR